MSIITKLLDFFGIYPQAEAQDNLLKSNEHIADIGKIESIKPIIAAEVVKDSIHLEYPLLILREQILDCAFKNITRNDQGVMEDFFFDYLSRAFPNTANNAISIQTEKFSLTPDLAIIDEVNNIYITIEIDEPYSVGSSGALIPIHTVGSDTIRNKYFAILGWSVIRFAEEQIAKHPEMCVEAISHFVSTGELPKTKPVKCWTTDEAQSMIDITYRNSYLPFPFEGIKADGIKSYAAYRSFEFSSLSMAVKQGEQYVVLALNYPRKTTATGEIIAVGNHPQQCWIKKELFISCIHRSNFQEIIKEYDLHNENILPYINTHSKIIECYGKINGKHFNIIGNKFEIIVSNELIADIKQVFLDGELWAIAKFQKRDSRQSRNL